MKVFGLLACLVSVVKGLAPRIEVVAGPNVVEADYSQFFDSLRASGFSVSSGLGADGNFDHLILLAPSAKSVNSQKLAQLIEQGKNIFFVQSPEITTVWADFSREFTVDFDATASVIDHFNYDTQLDDGSHTTLVVPVDQVKRPFIQDSTISGAPILFKGMGHQIGSIPLLCNVLHGSPTAYSYELANQDPITTRDDIFISGSSLGLVSAFQARNNARITFIGSLDMLSNKYLQAAVNTVDGKHFPRSGNEEFLNDIAKWTFQQLGVIRIAQTALTRVNESAQLDLYRVNEVLEYKLSLESLGKEWEPFVPTDLQFEFTMLDPHIRALMSPSAESSVLTRVFQVPDKHGVFTLRADYRRPGWSWVEDKKVVSIAPLRHDQYERYIVGALPWYMGAGSVATATTVFITLWLKL